MNNFLYKAGRKARSTLHDVHSLLTGWPNATFNIPSSGINVAMPFVFYAVYSDNLSANFKRTNAPKWQSFFETYVNTLQIFFEPSDVNR